MESLSYSQRKSAGREKLSRDGAAVIIAPMEISGYEANADAPASSDNLDARLIAVAGRDRDAFDVVYSETVSRVLALATRIVGDVDTADDVASETYLQIWRQAASFDPARGNALAWIMTICRSRALDLLRRRAAQQTRDAEATQQGGNGDDDALHDLLQATDRRSAVHSALATLEPADRQLLALAYFRGYTHSELAAITGEPLGTVKTRTRRALEKLRKTMRKYRPDTGEMK